MHSHAILSHNQLPLRRPEAPTFSKLLRALNPVLALATLVVLSFNYNTQGAYSFRELEGNTSNMYYNPAMNDVGQVVWYSAYGPAICVGDKSSSVGRFYGTPGLRVVVYDTPVINNYGTIAFQGSKPGYYVVLTLRSDQSTPDMVVDGRTLGLPSWRQSFSFVSISDANVITYTHWNLEANQDSSYRTTGGGGTLVSIDALPRQTGSGNDLLTFDGSTIRFSGARVVDYSDPIWAGTRPQDLFPHCANSAGDVVFGAYRSGSREMWLAYDSQEPPHIVKHPSSCTVSVGTNVVLDVIAAGASPMQYQWRKDGVAIAGATTSIVQISNVQTNDSGDYTIVVANSYGSATSASGTLVVLEQCPVGPLTLPRFPAQGYISAGLDPEFAAKLFCFEEDILAQDATISKISGYRSKSYQAHLREIFEHANTLKLTPGINVISTAPLQFETTSTTLGCQAVVDELNQEILNHWPNTFPPKVAKNSPHSSGRAVDWCIGGLTQSQITQLATVSGLYRPLADEPCHFTPLAPNADLLFTGNSPINILVTDPLGWKIGFDPLSGSSVNDIGTNATYSGAGSTPQVIQILASSVVPGQYTVSGVGTGTGAYSIDVQITCEDESDRIVQRVLAVGAALSGQPLPAIPPLDCLNSTMWLTCSLEGPNLRLQGPQWATNGVVECTTNLLLAQWAAIGEISPTQGLLVTNLVSRVTFFRLRSP